MNHDELMNHKQQMADMARVVGRSRRRKERILSSRVIINHEHRAHRNVFLKSSQFVQETPHCYTIPKSAKIKLVY